QAAIVPLQGAERHQCPADPLLIADQFQVLDLPMLEVRYEDLIGDQEGVSRALVEFCGLDWDERCLRFHETRRVVATASYDQVRQPLYSRSKERWRHYERHLAPLRKALSEPTVWESCAPARAPAEDEGATCASKKQQAYAALQGGDWAGAERLYAQACHLDPDDAEAHYNLGTVAKELGHYEQAQAAYREALRLRPNAVAALHNMGTVLAELDRLDEAAHYFEAAIAQTPNAMSHSNLGNVYTRQQRLNEAISHYRQALALEPDRPEIYNNLGTAQRHLGYYQEALAAYEQAVQLRPDYGEAYINLGAVLLHQRRLDESREAYRRALELDPESRKAVAGEASVLEKQGEFEQSYERLRPFLEAGEVEANMALVLAALCRPLKRCEEAVNLLERVLAGEGTTALSVYDRILVHFALGRLLDAAGEYDRAFAHYHQGNRLANQRFDPQAHARYIDTLISTYTPDFMARAPRSVRSEERPVFIIGMPRSGTSLVEQILDSHPRVFGAGELEEISSIVTGLYAALGATVPYPQCLSSLTDAHCDRLADRYLDYIGGLAPSDALRVTDKMPSNFLNLGLIAMLFPEARIIHCVRDPMDTCLSCYFQNFAEGHPYTYDLAHLGFYYRQYQRLMAHWRKVLTLPMMEVRYEDLVGDQEGVSRALVAFCGLEWDDRCLRFHETRRVVATASYDQVRQPLYSRSKERWRHYKDHLEPLRRALDLSGTGD
ncbi:MAG TPA: sulfotransferase, partial [Gammaproteobacteria bacterium]|nr:sulfotransferase [Gammaproteobacteria bacterium]